MKIWGWRHTHEWMNEVARLIQKEPIENLSEAWAEIQIEERDSLDEGSYTDGTYEKLIAEAQAMDDSILAQAVEDFAFRQCLSYDGGYHAWYCPHGCMRHTVSPREEEEEGTGPPSQEFHYECLACGKTFTRTRNRPVEADCPGCGSWVEPSLPECVGI